MCDNVRQVKMHHINAKRASTFLARLTGLMFRKSLRPEEVLLLSPCSSIHTSFMQFPIDVVFLDHNYQVVGIVAGLPPWRWAGGYPSSRHVLELEAGRVKDLAIKLGDYLCLI